LTRVGILPFSRDGRIYGTFHQDYLSKAEVRKVPNGVGIGDEIRQKAGMPEINKGA
jgi:hypothetical protein